MYREENSKESITNWDTKYGPTKWEIAKQPRELTSADFSSTAL